MQNEYLGDCKVKLLYDKHFYLSLWKTRWKVWKTRRIFKAFEPVLWKIRKGIELYLWKTYFLKNPLCFIFAMNIQ